VKSVQARELEHDWGVQVNRNHTWREFEFLCCHLDHLLTGRRRSLAPCKNPNRDEEKNDQRAGPRKSHRLFLPHGKLGQPIIPATLRVDAFPNRVFSGRLIEIGSEAEYTPRNVQTKKERVNLVFRIKIQIDNPAGILKPGLPADADVG